MLMSIFFAFIATVAFCFLFNSPRKTMLAAGIIGAAGWGTFIFMRDLQFFSSPVSNLFATVVIALLSELFARIFKQPVTVYAIPGIIPLVPGLPMYQGMVYLMMGNNSLALEKLIKALLDAGAISLGILIVSSIFRVIKVNKVTTHISNNLGGERKHEKI